MGNAEGSGNLFRCVPLLNGCLKCTSEFEKPVKFNEKKAKDIWAKYAFLKGTNILIVNRYDADHNGLLDAEESKKFLSDVQFYLKQKVRKRMENDPRSRKFGPTERVREPDFDVDELSLGRKSLSKRLKIWCVVKTFKR